MNVNYDAILCHKRLRESTIKRNTAIEEFYSDKSRIIYSSSFRRLQQKAQVFSLEPNASVRTRLTHSLEVADLGRTMAHKIACELYKNKHISKSDISIIVAIVENACLLHDIGNPPFGHFGESAIRDWAKNSEIEKSLPDDVKNSELLQLLMEDFKEFDGNPQGFRTITKLHTDHDEYSLNLTYATLLCGLKYPRAAGEGKEQSRFKKAGYFQSEKDIVEKMYQTLNLKLHSRYPLTYIMEAADDIAYCMSDIADGIEKRILTEEEFVREFKLEWEKLQEQKKLKNLKEPLEKQKVSKEPTVTIPNELRGFNQDISIPWSKMAMEEAVSNFLLKQKEILNGTLKELISRDSELGDVLDTIKQVSRKILYTSIEAESIELTGYAVITGILKHYVRLLKLPYDDFEKILRTSNVKNMDVERRLFNRLGKRYVKAYRYAIDNLDEKNGDFKTREWWLRVHLLIDHVSGMTDEFALETYQMLQGINLLRS